MAASARNQAEDSETFALTQDLSSQGPWPNTSSVVSGTSADHHQAHHPYSSWPSTVHIPSPPSSPPKQGSPRRPRCRTSPSKSSTAPAVVEGMAQSINGGYTGLIPDPGSWGAVTSADDWFKVLPKKAGALVIQEVAKKLEEGGLISSWFTVKALSQIVQIGDQAALHAISTRLEHRHERVRQSATQALKAVVRKGDLCAIDAVADRLEHPDEGVRRAATDALMAVTDIGCIDAIASVAAKLTHDDSNVRHSATKALGVIAERGDPHALNAISMRLGHESEGVRKAASHALSVMSHNVDTLVVMLEDENVHVRWGAVKKIGECLKGDSDAVAAIIERLAHPDHGVRKSAAKALGQIAMKDDAETLHKVASLFEHPEECIKDTAVKALKLIATKGNACAVHIVSRFLDNKDVQVRAAAARALATISNPGDPEVIHTLCELLGHGSEDVRVAASKCLSSFVPRGHHGAIAAVSKWLGDDDPTIRRTAIRALGGIVDESMSSDVAIVMTRMQDEDVRVRLAAIHALKRIVPTVHAANSHTKTQLCAVVPSRQVTKSKTAEDLLASELEFMRFTPQAYVQKRALTPIVNAVEKLDDVQDS